MKKTKIYYLAGFAVEARSRGKAVSKFVRHGFARWLALDEVRLIHKGENFPFAFLKGKNHVHYY